MIFSPVGSSFSSFFLGIVLFECHLLDKKWRVARDRANFVVSRTYSVLLVTETETQNGKHRLKAFIDLMQPAPSDLSSNHFQSDRLQVWTRQLSDNMISCGLYIFEFHYKIQNVHASMSDIETSTDKPFELWYSNLASVFQINLSSRINITKNKKFLKMALT